MSYMVLGWFSSGTEDPLDPGPATASAKATSGYDGTLKFQAASGVEVQWPAGTLTAQDGAVLNIAAGSTGAMIQATWIYLNPSVLTTSLQITTDEATAQSPGCVVIAVAEPFFVAQMAALGWQLPQGTDPSVTAFWTMLAGMVNGVGWQSSTLPPGGTPNGLQTPVSVAVGNTSVEALTALISAQAANSGQSIDSELLEALQLNLLDVLDQPDGAAVLSKKLRASFCQRRNGGYTWTVVDAPDSTSQPSEAVLQAEAAWLATLNQNQQALDAALLQLTALQRQLYLLWWRYQSYNNNGSFAIPCLIDDGGNPPAVFTAQLNPTLSGSLAWQVAQAQANMGTLQAKVTMGDDPAALEAAIASYAQK